MSRSHQAHVVRCGPSGAGQSAPAGRVRRQLDRLQEPGGAGGPVRWRRPGRLPRRHRRRPPARPRWYGCLGHGRLGCGSAWSPPLVFVDRVPRSNARVFALAPRTPPVRPPRPSPCTPATDPSRMSPSCHRIRGRWHLSLPPRDGFRANRALCARRAPRLGAVIRVTLTTGQIRAVQGVKRPKNGYGLYGETRGVSDVPGCRAQRLQEGERAWTAGPCISNRGWSHG